MGSVVVTGSSGWALPAAGFTNPSYISGPSGSPDPSGALGFDVSSVDAIAIAFDGTYTGQTLVHEQTMDQNGAAGWFPVMGVELDAPGVTGSGLSTTGICYLFPAIGVRHRIRVTALSTGTIIARINLTDQNVTGLAAAFASGNAAAATADSGNPVKMGGVFNTTPPTYTTGQRGDVQIDASGNMRALMAGGLLTPADGVSNASAERGIVRQDTGTTFGRLGIFPYLFNGTSWDRQTKSNATARLPTSAATTNAAVVKATAGSISAISCYNTTATVTYLKLYNKATAPTVGTDTPTHTLAIPPNGNLVIDFPNGGHYFSAGIGYGIVTDASDAGVTAPALGAIVGLNISYA